MDLYMYNLVGFFGLMTLNGILFQHLKALNTRPDNIWGPCVTVAILSGFLTFVGVAHYVAALVGSGALFTLLGNRLYDCFKDNQDDS